MTIIELLQLSFVQKAIVVTLLIALCAGLLGIILVAKNFSHMSSGLSYVAFSSSIIALVVGLSNQLLITLPVTILCSILLLKFGPNKKIRGDAMIAISAIGAISIGYLILNIFPPSSNLATDVCTILFGNSLIMSLTTLDLILYISLAIIVIAFFIIFNHQIMAVTFDEEFSTANNVKVGLLNMILAVVIAVVIVLSMRLVGSLLVGALIIFPALSAIQLFDSFKKVTIFSGIFSVVFAVVGLFISLLWKLPTGSTIAVAELFCFIICLLISKLMKK